MLAGPVRHVGLCGSPGVQKFYRRGVFFPRELPAKLSAARPAPLLQLEEAGSSSKVSWCHWQGKRLIRPVPSQPGSHLLGSSHALQMPASPLRLSACCRVLPCACRSDLWLGFFHRKPGWLQRCCLHLCRRGTKPGESLCKVLEAVTAFNKHTAPSLLTTHTWSTVTVRKGLMEAA